MDRDEFWQHVDAARARTVTPREEGLRAQLQGLSLEELASFQDHFERLYDLAYRWDLWGAVYLMRGGCSDDCFSDHRNGLIALGRTVFEAALAAPDSLDDVRFLLVPNEWLWTVATELIQERGGSDPSRYALAPTEPAGEDWDFDDAEELERRYPRLWARFGGAF